MRILGIDPGSAATGYGVVERREGRLIHVAHGVVRPLASDGLPSRLDRLYCTVRDVIEGHAPDCAAVEQVFVAANPRSALVLGQARGAILAAIAGAGVPVNEYSPTRIKKSVTGNGRASKQQVQKMVQRLLSLDRAPASDAADALAAAISHANAGRLEALGKGAGVGRRGARAGSVTFTARRTR